MKKFATVSLATALTLSLLAVGASADGDKIKRGTPEIDGVLDEAYTYSLALKDLGTAPNAYETEWPGDCTADIYFLYDDDMVYICAVVNDSDVTSKGEEFTQQFNPIQNDVIEFRISLNGEIDTIKVSIDAYGYNCFGLTDHMEKFDYTNIEYATTYTDTQYIVEVGIPCTEDGFDMIETGKFGFAYQLNDIDDGDGYYYYTSTFAGEEAKTPIFYELSDEIAAAPVVETEADTATDATEETVATAPATFDAAVVAMAITAVSGAAYVLSSKKH